MTTSVRPVVALDIDDVLNFDGAPVRHTITLLAADQPKSPFVRGHGLIDKTLTVGIDPAVGPWITVLRERADVVWASTWEHAANTHLAPLLGIEPLPVAMSVATDPPRFGYAKNGDSIGWKASVLRVKYTGRPLVWADDGAHNYQLTCDEDLWPGQTWYDWRAPHPTDRYASLDTDEDGEEPFVSAPTLVVTPYAATGLTLAHRAEIDAFVADPYGHVAKRPVWDDLEV